MKNLIPSKNVLASIMMLVLLGVFFVLPAPLHAQDDAVDDPDLIDKVTLKSGKSYVGEIIAESDDTITMLVTLSGISAQKTFNKADCSSIRRDAVSRTGSGGGGSMTNSTSTRNEAGKLTDRPDPNDPRPVVYRIPLMGLMGWDVSESVVKKLWEEAKEVNAKYVIFEFDCHRGLMDLEGMRDIFKDIDTEAVEEEITLIAWVKEAKGASVAFVLMFPEIVFHSDGFMGEGERIDEFLKERFTDADVRAKMIAAWVGHLRGMAIDGGYNAELCEAMIRPEVSLYVKMEGEIPVFKTYKTVADEADNSIESVDTSSSTALRLEAKKAKIYGVTRWGTADDIRTLMRRMSVREYIHYEGKSTKTMENWVELRDRGWTNFGEYMQDIGMINALPVDERQKIGQTIQKWSQVLRMLKNCPPHTKPPYGWDDEGDRFGLMSIDDVKEIILRLRMQLKQINDAERNGRNGGRGGGGGGRGRPGGGGGGGGGG